MMPIVTEFRDFGEIPLGYPVGIIRCRMTFASNGSDGLANGLPAR